MSPSAPYDLAYPQIPDFSVADPSSAIIQRLPQTSNLTTISFDCSSPRSDSRAYANSSPKDLLSFVPLTSEVLPIAPDIADWIMKTPHLHSIYIDDEDTIVDYPTLDHPSNSEPVAIFTSMRHGDSDELLHARILVNDIVTYSYSAPGNSYRRILHTRSDGLIKQMIGVIEISPPVFHDFTYYQGEVIPMGVIKEIQEVEGITDMSYWDRRGAQVGKAAWDVIRLWRERIVA